MPDEIFAGGKFFISFRVKNGNKLRDLIRDHGGEVVIREGDAHHLLFDDGRPDNAPFGALSYRIVPDSVEKGQFQDTQQYLIKGITPRPAGSTRAAKPTRTPFTPTEDRWIYERVREYESGNGQAGRMDMWKQMELEKPNHTWQSYMDRYNKRLKLHPPTRVSDDVQVPQTTSGQKRSRGEEEQHNESNTKRKRVSVEPEPERQPDERQGSHDVFHDAQEAVNGETQDRSTSSQKHTQFFEIAEDAADAHESNTIAFERPHESEEQPEMFETAKEQFESEAPSVGQDTQFQETLSDHHAFSMPEPPGGFLETQLQEAQIASQFIRELVDHAEQVQSLGSQLVEEDSGEQRPAAETLEEQPSEETSAEEEVRPFPVLYDKFRRKGYTDQQILKAAHSTCGHAGLMVKVLRCLRDGHGFPEDVAGVWTPEDSDLLEHATEDDIKYLEGKHGAENVQIRREFLEVMRREGASTI